MKDDKPLDHEYDGIQEFDNPLPRWWLATFYGAIVFSALYVAYYHIGSGPSLGEELSRDLAEIAAAQAAKQPGSSGPDESALAAALADPQQKELGAARFQSNCVSCHGAHGEGGIGPNLTDAYWIHGNGGLPSLASVVGDGVPEKGMPPWKGMLKPAELVAVVAYVKSLQGTKPANAKAPQGTVP